MENTLEDKVQIETPKENFAKISDMLFGKEWKVAKIKNWESRGAFKKDNGINVVEWVERTQKWERRTDLIIYYKKEPDGTICVNIKKLSVDNTLQTTKYRITPRYGWGFIVRFQDWWFIPGAEWTNRNDVLGQQEFVKSDDFLWDSAFAAQEEAWMEQCMTAINQFIDLVNKESPKEKAERQDASIRARKAKRESQAARKRQEEKEKSEADNLLQF